MLLSSSHWFRVTGSGTFQMLLMMVVALFALQSSMAHPSSTSTFRSSIHEYQEKQANRSALTLSGSLANPSTPSNDTHTCKYNHCGNCGLHSVCVNLDGETCDCECEVGYVDWGRSNCTLYGCVVYDNVNEQRDSCIWNNSYCIASKQLCVCKPGFEPRPSEVKFVCQPIPGWTTKSTTTSSTASTSSSTTTSTELPNTTSTTSSWISKNTFLIVGILMFVLVMALTLLYVFGCHCCRKEAKIGDTSGANYRRQAYQQSPANSKVTSKESSKATSKAASNATSKATSKINSAKATSKR